MYKSLGEYLGKRKLLNGKGVQHDIILRNGASVRKENVEERNAEFENESSVYSIKPSAPTGNCNPRPTEVSKLFGKDLRYSGKPTEPLRRRFKTFLNAVGLCNVDIENSDHMLLLLGTYFLTGQALHHYQDVVRETAVSLEEVIELLQAHFLGLRAKRVNDEIWNERFTNL